MADVNAPAQPASAHEGLLARHPLILYFLIAYAGTWLLVLPVLISEDGVGLLPFSTPLEGRLVPVFAPYLDPTLSALIMTGVTEVRAGIRHLLRRIVLWQVGLRWYLFALIGPPVIYVLGLSVLPGVLASFETPDPLAVLSFLGLFFVVIWSGASSSRPSGACGTCPCSGLRLGMYRPLLSTSCCMSSLPSS